MEPAARRAGIATPSSGNHGRIVGVVISGGNVDGTVFARALAEG
jgi:threonine dehydratase